jgi:hypothetical protein
MAIVGISRNLNADPLVKKYKMFAYICMNNGGWLQKSLGKWQDPITDLRIQPPGIKGLLSVNLNCQICDLQEQ